jgi:hypothetical protein
MRKTYNVLVRKTEGKRPIVRPRRRWEDNIKISLGGNRAGSIDWIHLAQDMDQWWVLVNTAMNIWIL